MADSTARIIEISDAIVADINANVRDNRPWEAKRSYSAEYRLQEQKAYPQVDVLFASSVNEQESRGGVDGVPNTEGTYPFEISVQQACNYGDTGKIDLLVNLVARLAGRYKASQPFGQHPGFVTNYPEFAAITGENAPLQVVSNEVLYYDPICLKKHQHFHGRISIVFKELA